jgi:hypothetical protein
MRSRLRIALLVAIAALYLLSVPWYRETGGTVGFWFGLPDWVAVALGCYIAVAILNSVAWLVTDMPGDEQAAEAAQAGETGRAGVERAEKGAGPGPEDRA